MIELDLDDVQREAIILALSHLALIRPGWDQALGDIAEAFGDMETFQELKDVGVSEIVTDIQAKVETLPVTDTDILLIRVPSVSVLETLHPHIQDIADQVNARHVFVLRPGQDVATIPVTDMESLGWFRRDDPSGGNVDSP